MKKEKEFEIQSINYALYQARLKKKVSLMEAAVNLNIYKLHLSLIEKGYLHVSKKLQPRFIEYYKLDKDFFKNNTTYVTPIEVKYEDPHIDGKIRERIKKKRTKVVSGIISLLLLGILGTGLYYFNREKVNPRAAWSSEFASFRDQFTIHHDDEQTSTEYPDDIDYYIEEYINDRLYYKIALPSKDINVTGMYVTFAYYFDEGIVTEITNFVYNQKKVVVFEGDYKDEDETKKVYAISSYSTNRHNYSLPIITLTTDEGDKDFGPETVEYQHFESIFLKDGKLLDYIIDEVDKNLSTRGFNYKFDLLMNDTQIASAYKVFNFRLGFRLMLAPSILLAFSLSVLVYALVKSRKIKPKKKKERAYIVHKSEYTADAALVYRSVPNDTTFPMVIPECGLRILALAILFLSSFGTVWLTSIILTGQESMKALNFNAIVSNVFVAGLTLAFFLKLDVYHKKTNRELLENILTLFVFGLLFYVAECIIYACLSSQGNIYSEILKLLQDLIPGNIIWNLMLYSLIFLFLFTTPKKIEDTPHKALLWRLGSVIPTLLLLSAFVVKGALQELSPYIKFLFHTNGVLLTAFAIFYLYSLFFFQQYVSLKYGKDFTKVFLDSRRYALAKNIIACIVIFVLSLIDLLFYFKLPLNGLNLGNNWIIAILIPFILFYHPHIGKRRPKWDLAYTVMYVLFLVGGFVIAAGMLSNALDLKQIAEIMG